jgi:hypothetical protein
LLLVPSSHYNHNWNYSYGVCLKKEAREMHSRRRFKTTDLKLIVEKKKNGRKTEILYHVFFRSCLRK